MADNKNQFQQPLFGSFKRLGKFPIDPTEVFSSLSDLEKYLLRKNSTAYDGQKVVVCNAKNPAENSFYILTDTAAVELEDDGTFNIAKYSVKLADISITTELAGSIGTVSQSVSTLEKTVNTIKTEIGLSENGEDDSDDSLINRLGKVEDDLQAIIDSIGEENFDDIGFISSTLSKLSNDLSLLQAALESHNAQFDNILRRSAVYLDLNSEVKTNAGAINQLQHDLSTIRTIQTGHTTTLDKHWVQINDQRTLLVGIRKTLENLTTSIRKLYATKNDLKTEIDAVKKLINDSVEISANTKNVAHSVAFSFASAFENKYRSLPVGAVISSIRVMFNGCPSSEGVKMSVALRYPDIVEEITEDGETIFSSVVLVPSDELIPEAYATYDFDIDNYTKAYILSENNEIVVESDDLLAVNGKIIINYFV